MRRPFSTGGDSVVHSPESGLPQPRTPRYRQRRRSIDRLSGIDASASVRGGLSSSDHTENGVTSGVAQTQAQSAVMASTAANFDTVNSSLTSMLNRLMSELSMLSSGWKGMAAGEFEKVKTQYAKDLSDLNRALGETAEAIRTSGVGYDASDSAAASRVTKSGGGYTLPL